MAEIHFDLTGNNSDLVRQLKETRKAINEVGKAAGQQSIKIEELFESVSLGADKAAQAVKRVGIFVNDMRSQLDAAAVSLKKLDIDNQLRLGASQPNNGTASGAGQTAAVEAEAAARALLSSEIEKQLALLLQLNEELLTYQNRVEELLNQQTMFSAQLLNVGTEMMQLKEAGLQNSDVYEQLRENAMKLTDSMGGVNEKMAEMSGSDSGIQGAASGLSVLSSMISAATGTMEVFSYENDNLQRILGKVQTAISVVTSLEEVGMALNQKSSMQLSLFGNVKMWWKNITLQAAAAQGIESTAAVGGTVANYGLAGAFQAIGLAIKNIPVFGWIAAGISALITVYSVWSSKADKQKEQQEAAAEAARRQQETEEQLRNSVAASVASQMVEYSKLQTAYKSLGDDMKAKKEFVEDNQEAFRKLGVSVGSVSEAENLLVDKEDVFIASLERRAVAAATLELATENYKEAAKKIGEANNYEPTKEDKAVAKNKQNEWLLNQKKAHGYSGNIYELATSDKYANSKDPWTQDLRIKYSKTYDQALVQQINKRKDEIRSEVSEYQKQGLDAIKSGAEINITTDAALLKENIRTSNDKKTTKPDKSTIEAQQRIANETLELQRKNAQQEVDVLYEGSEKKRAQIELNFKNEIEALEAKKQKWIAEQGGLTKEQEAAINMAEAYAGLKRNNSIMAVDEEDKTKADREKKDKAKKLEEEVRAMDEYYAAYGSYLKKREAIKALAESKKKGKNKGEQLIIEAETNKTLYNLDLQANKGTANFSTLFGDMSDKTIKDLRKTAAEAQATLDLVKNNNWDDVKDLNLGISEESFNYLKATPEEIEKVQTAINETNKQTSVFDSSLKKIGGGFEKVFEKGADPKKLQEGLSEIEDGMNKAMEAGQFLSEALSGIGDAFGSDALKGVAEGMNMAMDAASSAMSGAKAGAMFGPWGAAAGAAIGLVSSLGSALAKLHDAKHEKRIQQMQEQIEVLKKSYDNLGDSVEKAYSQDASKMIAQQNEMLERQKVLIQNQMAEERSKKKADEGKLKEYQNQIDDINKLIGENKEKQIDAILGSDVKSAIDNFAQAYADAWAAGDDRAKSSKDLVKNMIKQMVMEALKAASSQPMEALRKKLAGYFSDGIISSWEREQIEKDAEELTKQLDSKFGWADEYLKGDEEEQSREASKKGIATASQESVDENNGRLTVIQEHTYNISEGVRDNGICLANMDKTMTSMMTLQGMAVSHLSNIENHTARLATIEQAMFSIKTGIDTLNTNGLTLKR